MTEKDIEYFRPVGGGVLVKEIPLFTSKTIALPEVNEIPLKRAVVVAVGPGAWNKVNGRLRFTKVLGIEPGAIVHYAPMFSYSLPGLSDYFVVGAGDLLFLGDDTARLAMISRHKSKLEKTTFEEDAVKMLEGIDTGQIMREKEREKRKPVRFDYESRQRQVDSVLKR